MTALVSQGDPHVITYRHSGTGYFASLKTPAWVAFMVSLRSMATSPGLVPVLVVAVLLCPLLIGIRAGGG